MRYSIDRKERGSVESKKGGIINQRAGLKSSYITSETVNHASHMSYSKLKQHPDLTDT